MDTRQIGALIADAILTGELEEELPVESSEPEVDSRPSFLELVQIELRDHNIVWCRGCKNGASHSRGYATPDSRTVHFSGKLATRSTLFTMLHEIGHVVKRHGKSSKLRRWEEEAEATAYARKTFRTWGITIPRKVSDAYSDYISRKERHGRRIAAGLRRRS